MLRELLDYPGAGEVYLPSVLLGEVIQNYSLLDAVQLTLARPNTADSLLRPIINTSHSTGLAQSIMRSPKCISVFLARDPVDVVLSRTYRKDDYKRAVAPFSSRSDYLDTNISFVGSVYRAAAKFVFEHTIKYESLLSEPEAALGDLLASIGERASDADLARVSRKYSPANAHLSRVAGNLFTGEYESPSNETLDYIRKSLRNQSAFFGY